MFLNAHIIYVKNYFQMGKLSTSLSSDMLFFLRSFTACGRYSHWTRHLAADIHLIEIQILCFIKQPPIFYFLVKNRAMCLNICDSRQPQSYLWSCCHNEDEENIEPKNMEEANSFLGDIPTGLKPISEYPHLIHVA